MGATITPRTLADSSRAKVQASTRLLAEWLALYRPGTIQLHNFALGPTEQRSFGPPVEARYEGMLRRFNRYADAVVITPATIEVIEAKPIADGSAISQVRIYAKLVATTPALREYAGRQVIARVIFGTFDQVVMQEARELGVEWDVYSPTWLNDYLANRYYSRRRNIV